MAQLKIIAEVDATIRTLGDLIESLPSSEEPSKSQCDPLCYRLIWCKSLTGEMKFKDPENGPAYLEKEINEISRLINEATIEPPYQQQMSNLCNRNFDCHFPTQYPKLLARCAKSSCWVSFLRLEWT